MNNDGTLSKFGQVLKKIRKEKKIRQVDVASGAHLNYRHYQDIEAGHVNVSLMTIFKIANFLKIRPEDIIKDVTETSQ